MSGKREVWSVRWNKGSELWDILCERWHVASEATKKLAVSDAADRCRSRQAVGELVQLKVYNKNGRIAFERTYGRDPRRTKG